MRKILLDTDVLIAHLRGQQEVSFQVRGLLASNLLVAYTAVSVAEIYQGIRSNEKEAAEHTFSTMECLEINRAVGKRAGEYLKSYAKSHGLEVPDALIAASAFVHKFSLCTFNWKHYPMSDIGKHRLA